MGNGSEKPKLAHVLKIDGENEVVPRKAFVAEIPPNCSYEKYCEHVRALGLDVMSPEEYERVMDSDGPGAA